MDDSGGGPPATGWAWSAYTFAPFGKHCESCLGINRVRWIAIPLAWTPAAGPRPERTNTRWVYLCDYCTWPDGGLLTRISLDGQVAVVRSSTHGTPRIVIIVPRTKWLQ